MEKQRIVVKVGTSTLTHDSGNMDLRNMEHLVRALSDLHGTVSYTHLYDGLHVFPGIKGPEVLQTFAHASQLYWHAQLLGDGHHDAALGSTVQLGENNSGETCRLLKGAGLNQAVLSSGGIQHQQRLPGAAGTLPVYDLG